MSRELRFALILLGSIFGVVVVVTVPLVLFAQHTARSAFEKTSEQRVAIARNIGVIPRGYRATNAVDFFGTLWAELSSSDDTSVIELAQVEHGTITRNFDSLADHVRCTQATYAGEERIEARWQVPTLRTWTCPNGAKIAYGEFLSKGGRAQVYVASRFGDLDRKALV